MNVYFKILTGFAIIFLSFISGFYVEHLRYVDFQQKVASDGKIQEQKNKDLLIQQQLITKQVTNDYENKLQRINAYYNGLHDPSIGKLSSTSTSTIFINGVTKDSLSVAQDCAIETQKLISLQAWIAENAK